MKSSAGFDVTPLPSAARDVLAEKLTPEERLVILDHGTERPFCGPLLHQHERGTYVCRLCDLPLFSSEAKFESGTGWPSFFAPFDPDHVLQSEDRSYGMRRVEIRCRRCDAHLGHVFPDGPRPTGLRFCLNSVAMSFTPGDPPRPPVA